jgi:hypothetical protein
LVAAARRLLFARAMRLALAIAFALALSPVSVAGPEPGTDSSRAGMCDEFDGLSFVFCVAMCEARECDRQAPGDERCELLARGFASVSNGAAAPCVVRRFGRI